MTSAAVVIVAEPESSGSSCESTPLTSLASGGKPSEFCTSCGALASGSNSTTAGDERRRAFEAGRKLGATTYFQGPVMEQIGFELTLLRNLHESHCTVAEQRERLIAHWKAEAVWWRAEHDALRDKFNAFVKDMARRFPK